MGLLDRVNAALAESRGVEARAIGGVPWRPWDDPFWRFDVGGPLHPSRQTAGGVDGALRLQPIYSCVRLLAEGVAMLPLQQFRETGDRNVKMPLGQLLSKPSAVLNTFDWLYQYVTSAALHGTAWGYITQRDGYGYPVSIEWLPPEMVGVEEAEPYNPAKARIFFQGKPVSREDLMPVRAFTIPGRTPGISPLKHFQMLIEAGSDALAYGRDWFRGGGFPPGVLQNTQYEVEDEQSEKIRGKIVDVQRRRVPLVIGRDWTYTPITVPPDQAQFIQTMQLNATQIAAIYGVPANKVGGTTAAGSVTYANAAAEQLGLVQDTLDPWLVRLEAALADCLPASQIAQFNRNARLRMDPASRWTMYQTARDIGGMNLDEIRGLEDMAPLPKAKTSDDWDGTDYTPLQVAIAAARGAKELLGEGEAPQSFATPPKTPGPSQPGKLLPLPVPAVNGSNGSGSAANGKQGAPAH